jgi:hypothetical protein
VPTARRRVLRVAEALLICGTGITGYRSCALDQRGDPEAAMPAIVLTLVLGMSLVACLAVDYLIGTARTSPEPAAQLAGRVEFGEGAAIVSAVTGALAWLPIIPITGPFVLAAVATLSGLFALRTTNKHHTRQRSMAMLGGGAGVLYILVWLAHR